MLSNLLLIGVLIMINALLSGYEMALVTARRVRLQLMADDGNWRAAAVLKAQDEPGASLAAVQIGITLVGTLASTIGGAEAVTPLAALVGEVPWLAPVAEQVALALVVTAITISFLLLGELVPKQLALRHAEALAMGLVRPVTLFQRVAYLPMRALDGVAAWLIRLLPGSNDPVEEEGVTEEEIALLVRQAAARGSIEVVEERLIQRIFAYTDRYVRDVMQPRGNIVALDVETPPTELMTLAQKVGFSRFPVFEKELDRPLGYVHIKDIMWAQDEASLRPFLRPLVYIPETASLPAAFSRLTRARRHVALVLDEFGGTEGLVTLEDLLEVIVGEIEDEHSPVYEPPNPIEEGVWLCEGTTPIPEAQELLDIDFDDSGFFTTLAGFILHEIGALPQEGTVVDKYGYRFTVTAMEERRVSEIRVARLDEATPAAAEGENPGAS